MKNILSLLVCVIISIALLQCRVANIKPGEPLKITQWDANGYYLYLPSILIYHDYKKLTWLEAIDQKYRVTGGSGHGGDGYQTKTADNGNYVFMYQGGVAMMELPFFLIAHFIAQHSHYPPDGFSPPYQYALGFGIIFYSLLAALVLRKLLLVYFNDLTTALTLLLVCLATNYIQYSAVDSGQSHAYLFLLYTLVLYATYKWHKAPSVGWACVTGFICGFATMTRPTEAIIIFIPLFWDTHTKAAAKAKWAMVRQHTSHIGFAAACGILALLPQLIYWKLASGSWVFDVGSKWKFLNPYFRVLFGFEKGWFIYTPVTVLFIVGMFFMKGFQFRKSVLWFCLLNIYIIIAWDDWRYGGSYSTRALVQSYPVFALPLAALVDKVIFKKWRPAFYVLCAYFIGVNLFQINQYCKTILHFNDMNRRYYARIYLNPNPTPLDMSLLDSNEIPPDIALYKTETVVNTGESFAIKSQLGNHTVIADTTLPALKGDVRLCWYRIKCELKTPDLWQAYLNAAITTTNGVKQGRVRLFSPISDATKANSYEFWLSTSNTKGKLVITITTPYSLTGEIKQLEVTRYYQEYGID